MVGAEGSCLTIIGVALGVAGAFAVTRVLKNMLFGVGAADGVTFAAAALLLAGVAAIATLVPAWRAARIDPTVALRHD